MADAAVSSLLNHLTQLLLNHATLIANAKDEVEKLEKSLRIFQAFLKDTVKKRREDATLKELVKQIRDLVYEAEDIIDAFVTQAGQANSRSYFEKLYKKPVNLHKVARQVEKINSKIQQLKGEKSLIDFALINIADGGPSDQVIEIPILREENIVGFDEEAKLLIGYLKEETERLDIISIIGMPGLGKTTLAGMIFRDHNVQYEFSTRIWVYVSQHFSRKNVLLNILQELTTCNDDLSKKNDNELAKLVASHLETRKFLIVMDDVWTAENWQQLQEVLPMRNKMGKILITSRNMEVGNYCAQQSRSPYELPLLALEDAFKLLQLEVFHKPEGPEELEVYGKQIVDKCERLPLAIVVIGGILSKKVSRSGDVSAMEIMWKRVSENVSNYIVDDDPTKRIENIVALSYDDLPDHLRACFLYLAMFPVDSSIPAWNLTCMWIAERFTQAKEGISLEELAESYLEDLINRNLLRVDKRRSDGTVKTCRIHDVLRDFCRNEARKETENFLQEIKWSSKDEQFDPPINQIEQIRRVCVHSNATKFVSSKLYGPRVRSFVYFSEEVIDLTTETIATIPKAFKLLRVLEARSIRFTKLPSDIFLLVHLKYLAISSINLSCLPEAFSKLWNMETLIIYTKKRVLDVKANIFKMKQLRHFKTNASAALNPVSGVVESENIKTLGTISPESCTQVFFVMVSKVKQLGIRGRLANLSSGKNAAFKSLGNLKKLEKLKLINDAFPNSASETPLPSLPHVYQFPPNLKSLTLADTFLNWDQMPVLGLLEHLKVLKLSGNAFKGETWEAADGGFRELEVLYINGCMSLQIWNAASHHFPRLKSLQLKNCEMLEGIPICLADIQTFTMLNLYHAKNAATSAKQIEEKRRQLQEAEPTHFSALKLTIFPLGK